MQCRQTQSGNLLRASVFISPFDLVSLTGLLVLLQAGCFCGSSDTLFPAALAPVLHASAVAAATGAVADFFFFPPIKSPKHLPVYGSVISPCHKSSIKTEKVMMTNRKLKQRWSVFLWLFVLKTGCLIFRQHGCRRGNVMLHSCLLGESGY